MPPRKRVIDVAAVKGAARQRDGFRCVKCGRTNEEHKATTGRQLQVHRQTPGSPYRVEDCVTLCVACHGPEPKSPRGRADHATGEPKIRVWLSADFLADLRLTARRLGLTATTLIRMLLRENLHAYEERARLAKKGAS